MAERWMTADRAEQEATGTRGIPKSGIRRPDINGDRIAQGIADRSRNQQYDPSGPRPFELTHDAWLAAQGEYTATGDALAGFMDEYATQETKTTDPQALRRGTVLTPNIDTADPTYTNRLDSADAQRAQAQGMIGRLFGETFRLLPREGAPEIAAYESYTYVGIPAENAEAQLMELPLGVVEDFKSVAYQMGRYRGEKSATGLYADLLQISRERAAQGEFIAPDELLYELASEGKIPPPLGGAGEEEDSSGGGGGYGGGGFGGGGGATVQLTTSQQARFYIEQAYASLLGRAPTAEEVDRFIEVLREAELGNPVTVEVVGGVAAQTGGYDPQILAAEMAKAEEDYRSRQSYDYYNMFMDALAGG